MSSRQNCLGHWTEGLLSCYGESRVVYQAVDYLGIGRVRPFLDAVNEIFDRKRRETASGKDRLQLLWKTVWIKVHRPRWIFLARGMREAWKNGHINRWLADNCFGDYYTRTGLTLAQREMITFCFLAAQGWM